MKTCEEWLQGFNILYNNIASAKSPGFTPYEISWLLTKAQDDVVVALYNGAGIGTGFESTEQAAAYLAALVKQVVVTEAETGEAIPHIFSDSYVFKNPDDLLFRTFERCSLSIPGCGTEGAVDGIVLPVTQDELWRTKRNPFKGPNRNRVLRLVYSDIDVDNSNLPEDVSFVGNDGDVKETMYTEIVSKYPVLSYTVRYLARPEPIIIADLPSGLSINGKYLAQPCKLHENLHQAILEEAVRRAKTVWES